MGAWVMLGLLLAVVGVAGGRVLFRRYQDFRIRQHRRMMAWRAYKQSKGGPR